MKPENAEFLADLQQVAAIGVSHAEVVETLIRDRDEALGLAEEALALASRLIAADIARRARPELARAA